MGAAPSADARLPRIELVPVKRLRDRASAGEKVTYVRVPAAPSAAPALVGLLVLLMVELLVAFLVVGSPWGSTAARTGPKRP